MGVHIQMSVSQTHTGLPVIWPFRGLPAHPSCFKPQPGVAVDALLSLTWQIPSVLQPVCIWDLLELSTSFCAHCHPSSSHQPLPGTDSTAPARKLSSPALTARSPPCDLKGLSDCLPGHSHRLRGKEGALLTEARRPVRPGRRS